MWPVWYMQLFIKIFETFITRDDNISSRNEIIWNFNPNMIWMVQYLEMKMGLETKSFLRINNGVVIGEIPPTHIHLDIQYSNMRMELETESFPELTVPPPRFCFDIHMLYIYFMYICAYVNFSLNLTYCLVYKCTFFKKINILNKCAY